MTNPKGGTFERELQRVMRAHDINVVRVRLAGVNDEGDLRVTTSRGVGVLEAKNYRSLGDAVNAALRGLDEKVANAEADFGLGICRRHGKPDPLDAVVCADLRTVLRMGVLL